MKVVTGQRWRLKAVCSLETPDVPEVWTPDRKPRRAVLVNLQRMCQRCPVHGECASDAVGSEADSGVYAGVWVPDPHRDVDAWQVAMNELCRIAAGSSDRVAGDEALAVSA